MQNIFLCKTCRKPHSITNVSFVSVDEQSSSISPSSFTVTILTSSSPEQADSSDNWSSLPYLQIQPKLLTETFFLQKKFVSVLSRLVLCAQQYKQQKAYISCSTKDIKTSSILVKLAAHFPLSYINSTTFFKYYHEKYVIHPSYV